MLNRDDRLQSAINKLYTRDNRTVLLVDQLRRSRDMPVKRNVKHVNEVNFDRLDSRLKNNQNKRFLFESGGIKHYRQEME